MPKGAKTEIIRYKTSLDAIDFMRKNAGYFPVYADVVSDITAEWMHPAGHEDKDIIVYHLHGGAYTIGSPFMERHNSFFLAKYGNAKTFATSYRLAPQHQYPCAVIDAISGYQYLLSQGYDHSKIVISGGSAGTLTLTIGGGLALSLLLAIRDMGLKQPAGAILHSPWVHHQ